MKALKTFLLATTLGVTCLCGPALAQPKIAPKYHATPLEIAYLPKYCYNQYVDGALVGPVFSISLELCGYAMNHFCPALVELTQATQPSRPKPERRGALNSAIEDIKYTLRDMKPGCPITDDVNQAMERARALSLGVK